MPRRSTETPDPVDVHVGERVRTERIRLGLSQTELGGAIGVTFQQVQKYERGANRISASMLARVARTLHTPIGDFFPADDHDPSGPRLDIGSIKGGHEIAACFAAMTPTQRSVFLKLARELSN
ncbi:helix-turn-helix transcriptional regulator [Brevundimonas sp. BAL450]|uniref:helix-turn-helix domain-containing protein n=1 Tax=Brevundimonas sp. BAL450 TaxID=1708162 RepID=UPI0018CB74D9|nr:helix-turn-helix transcriptional regulator [Brevundimonas sp. BAL450]MBG7614640.1 helix-turn-helix transcriptional regulator [Brevundimonas sp. BAL450]